MLEEFSFGYILKVPGVGAEGSSVINCQVIE